MGNAVRLLHFLLTVLVFYVLTVSESTGKVGQLKIQVYNTVK